MGMTSCVMGFCLESTMELCSSGWEYLFHFFVCLPSKGLVELERMRLERSNP
jgi:hypothetical protein